MNEQNQQEPTVNFNLYGDVGGHTLEEDLERGYYKPESVLFFCKQAEGERAEKYHKSREKALKVANLGNYGFPLEVVEHNCKTAVELFNFIYNKVKERKLPYIVELQEVNLASDVDLEAIHSMGKLDYSLGFAVPTFEIEMVVKYEKLVLSIQVIGD